MALKHLARLSVWSHNSKSQEQSCPCELFIFTVLHMQYCLLRQHFAQIITDVPDKSGVRVPLCSPELVFV